MPADNLQEQLVKYLADAHSIEEQALQQMKQAPKLANAPGLTGAFEAHLAETERHERLTRERLEQLGASPSRFKDLVMKLGGQGFVWFARSQPDTTGKLVAHGYSYEALELGSDDLEQHLVDYLTDAHAIESQAIGLLTNGPKLAGDEQLGQLFEEHLAETRRHQELIAQRLEAHGASPSKLKDVAMRLGALNWGGFFAAHPDTVGKLCVFAFAFEHLEIGGYEQLLRVACRAGDAETATAVDRILAEERTAAGKLAAQFDHAAERSLEVQTV